MAMHVDFNETQKKFDPAAIKKQQNGKAATDKIAADAAAAKAHQDRASVNNAAALDIDAAEKGQQATDGVWGSTPAQSTSTALVPTVHLMSAAGDPTIPIFMGSALARWFRRVGEVAET